MIRLGPSPAARLTLAWLTFALLVGGVVVLGWLRGRPTALIDGLLKRRDERHVRAPRVASAMPVAPPHAPASVPMTSLPTPAIPVHALPKPEVEPTLTLVTFPPSSKGHRIFIDGRVVGIGPTTMTTKCGTHRVRIGSSGRVQVEHFPCGGELTFE